MDFMLSRALGDFFRGTWPKLRALLSKFGPVVFEKFLLVLAATWLISYFQNGMRRSEERLEKARRVEEILVDKPVSIVGDLPAHLDAFILYAEQIRSADLKDVSSAHLTELQAMIRSDIEGSRAYYSDDQDLESWAVQIKKTILAIRAKALSGDLGKEDLDQLEISRGLAYRFHRRVIELSVQKAQEPFGAVGEKHHPP